MGRPPSNGGPSFRFNQAEVTEMEAILQAHHTAMPAREVLVSLADKFSASPERSGKITVHMKQVWNWFQNRRYALRAKAAKSPGKLPMQRDMSAIYRNGPQVPPQSLPASSATVATLPQAPQHTAASSGKSGSENSQMEFEAKSARDGAWYDVATFLSHRSLETGDPEVLVRFAGFGPEEDEWVVVRKHVRQRSLPCESSECVAVLPGDLILCFQEGKEQALYFDAHVLDAQRRRHDVRGCRCRFLVRYDHDQSEEIVALRKICRRPETDYRLQQLHALNESTNGNQNKNGANIHVGSTLRVYPPVEATQKQQNVEPAVNLPQSTEINAQLKVEAVVVHSPGVNVPEASEAKAKQKVEPAVPAPSQPNLPAANEGNGLQKIEPALPAPADTNLIDVSEGKSQQKVENVVPSSSITNRPEDVECKAQQDVEPAVPAPPHTNMPEAMECKAQQNVEPVVPAPPHTNMPEDMECKAQQNVEPAVPAPHTNMPEAMECKAQQNVEPAVPAPAALPDTNMPEATEGEAQQKVEPVVPDPSDTNVPQRADIEVQNKVDPPVQLPSRANMAEVKSLQPDTEMASVQEVGEVKAQQPEVEMLDADKVSNSSAPPDSTAETSGVATTTDTDQEMQEAS